jgi:Predicted molecular chaperone distantly related to HSP70-fold metalloproteases
MTWLEAHLAAFPDLSPQDVQATLVALTAQTILTATGQRPLYVCGGGACNRALMQVLAAQTFVRSTAELGIEPLQVEALAFAWLAARSLAGQPGNLPEVTGARGMRVLGAIYPA